MPKYYHSGGFQFILTSESNGIGYYTITHSSGRHWGYNHPFLQWILINPLSELFSIQKNGAFILQV